MRTNSITTLKKRIELLGLIVILFLNSTQVSAQSESVENNIIRKDKSNAESLTMIFDRNCCGWTGGDGVYSVPLSDGRSVFIFGDTYLGTVDKDNSRVNTTPAVKNSLVILDNGEIETLVGSTKNSKIFPYFQTTQPDSTWYWPGHGFEHKGKLTFFLAEFKATGTGVFGFEWTGTSIATIKTNELGIGKPEIKRWQHETDIHFGMATLIEGDDVYVFGIKAFRLYLAKTKLTDANGWQFWDGNNWTSEGLKAIPIDDVYVSEQFSVFKNDGKYIIISQGAMLGKEIFAYSSESLFNSWSKPVELFTTPEPSMDSTLMTYNAVAHTQFINQDKLLISYCVNSTDFLSIYRDVRRYRPRFIEVPLSKLRR